MTPVRVVIGGLALAMSATALAACGSGRNAATDPSSLHSKPPSKQASGEYPSGFVTGPSTTQGASLVPTAQQTQSFLLDSSDVQKDWTRSGTGGVAACASPIPSSTGAAASADRAFYATGSSTPVLVEVVSSYQTSAAAAAYAAATAALGRCHSIAVLAGSQRLTGTTTATGPVVTSAPSESYQATVSGGTLHAGVAVIHEHTVDIALAFVTSSAPDPQTLKTYAQRALAKVTSAGV